MGRPRGWIKGCLLRVLTDYHSVVWYPSVMHRLITQWFTPGLTFKTTNSIMLGISRWGMRPKQNLLKSVKNDGWMFVDNEWYVWKICVPHCWNTWIWREVCWYHVVMVTSSNGNIFRVTGPLCGEFTGHRWIPRKGQWCGALMCPLICVLNKPLSKQPWGWWFETPSRSLLGHCNSAILMWLP